MSAIAATISPTTRDLEWAAGFLEGEGFFGKMSNGSGQRVNCRQNEEEPLRRLQAMFGGNFCWVSNRSNKLATKAFIGEWSVHGPRARGVMMTLFSLMTTRRRDQIRRALQPHI